MHPIRSTRAAPALLLALSLYVHAAFAAGAPQNVAQLAAAHAVPASPVPDIVLQLAQAYAASAGAIPDDERATLVQRYATTFFTGYTQASGDIDTQSALLRDAYRSGRAYRIAHPDQVDAILAGYGYTRVEADGTWTRGFEMNLFVPEDRKDEHWWVDSFGNVRWTELAPGQPDARSGSARVHVSGYLSQPGPHGHLGMADHALLATSFSFLDAPAP